MFVTVNREIFLHPDFKQDLKQTLCNYLNSLIDSELEKENADFDFIDECAVAVNSIREDFADAFIPIISKRDFMAKLGIRTNKFSRASIAVIAAIIMLLTANLVVASATDFNIIEELSKQLSELFFYDEEEEESETEKMSIQSQTETSTTSPPLTEALITAEPEKEISTTKPKAETTTILRKKEKSIKIELDDNFKTEYTVGETLNLSGLKVYLLYDDGSKTTLHENQYKITASSDFGKTAGYETVTVSYNEFEYNLKLRILNVKATPLLTSIYAIFPQDYDFAADDLTDIDLSFMQVYAVYSDSTEKELISNDYTVEFENISTFFEKKVIATVTYKTCSCSFTIFKK